jgi:hypothetical protein
MSNFSDYLTNRDLTELFNASDGYSCVLQHDQFMSVLA